MHLTEEAFVSGSLGQAVYRDAGAFRILDGPNAEPREAFPNEIQLFRHAAREVAHAQPQGLPVSIEQVRARLDEEVRVFAGLDGLLVGMDRDFSAKTRRRAISSAEKVLSADDAIAQRVRHRFLIPVDTQDWDPKGGLALALEIGANAACRCYRALAEGIIDRLTEDIAAVLLEKLGSGIDATRKQDALLRSGILAELALIEAQAERTALSALMFRRSDFPKLQAADPSGQILTALINRINSRTAPAFPPIAPSEDEGVFNPPDSVMAAEERALANYKKFKMTNEYDRLIGLIYEGILDDSHWANALAQVMDLVGAVGGGLGMHDMKTHQFRGLADFRVDPDLMPTYQRLAPTNKIWQEIGQRRLALTDQMVMPKAAFVRTELYADWFVPQDFHGVMACPILFKESASAVFVAFCDKRRGDFASADLAQIGRFAGHFGRALGIRLDRERTAEEFAAAKLMSDEIPDAILVVGFDVRLRHANKAGKTLLERRTVIRRLLNGRLEIRDPKADSVFARMVSGARGGELRLSGSGLEGFVIQVHPGVKGAGDTGAGLMIIRIIDVNREGKPPTPARLRERLGLSPRQSEVISELARGETEAKAAQKLGIGEPTVHEHIRGAYDKLELRSRAELLALLARHGFDTTYRSEKL